MYDFETALDQLTYQAELYRQNYEDALDEVRNLREKIHELEFERNMLKHQLDIAEKYIMHAG